MYLHEVEYKVLDKIISYTFQLSVNSFSSGVRNIVLAKVNLGFKLSIHFA